jgi:aryl-alcohol dehydrogenase-like predicted oxidoreductase
LGRDVVDLYQFHVWSDEWATDPRWMETLYQLRRSGMVRFIGISINDHQPANVIQALKSGLIDSVQVIYNIFDQSPRDQLFPYCMEHKIGVIVRVPFDEGGLTGSIRPGISFPDRDFRNRYFAGERKQQVWERVQAIAADAAVDVAQLPNLALRFSLSHCAVTTVIPGMRKPCHVERNAEASEQGQLGVELSEKLSKHCWYRNFYDVPVKQGDEKTEKEWRVLSLIPGLRAGLQRLR